MNFFRKLRSIFAQTSNDVEARNNFNKMYEDDGLFTYEDDGFVFHFSDNPQKILWSEIERLTAYKADLVTIDQLRLTIDFREGLTFTITEDTPGFFQFVLKTKDAFSSIPKDWDLKIIQPPFEANETVIYERGKNGDSKGE